MKWIECRFGCIHIFQSSEIIYMTLSNSDYEVYFTGVYKNQYT